MNRHEPPAGGFTLIEVLVAIAVVALAIGALMASMMRQIDGTMHLREKMIASWVATNQLELALLRNAASNRPPSDTQSGKVEMAGSQWYWRAQPRRSGQAGFVQLEIAVYASEKSDAAALATLVAILDSAHRLP
jgi:general secretion pathway protein I